MSNNEFINKWRGITRHFNFNDLWNKRLKLLGVFSESDLDAFVERLRQSIDNTDVLPFLLHNRGSIHISDKFSYITQKIVYELRKNIIQEISFVKINKKVEQSIAENLLPIVDDIVRNTIEFEYKVYCKAFPDKEITYDAFIKSITRRKSWLEYMTNSYPILCKDIEQFIIRYKHHIKLFAQRLSHDIKTIEAQFCHDETISEILGIAPICSDFHKGGLSTTLIKVLGAKGNIYEFYYKPKSLLSDIFWNKMIKQFHKWGLNQSVLLTENIDQNDYGWQKSIEADLSLNSQKDFNKFCFNQGVNIGIAFFLNIQDLIADNIILRKEYPIFFDLEMMFCPTPMTTGDYITESKSGNDYLQSVIKTGLVPCFGFETLNNIGVNNSGLSYVQGKNNMPNLKPDSFNCQELLNGFRYACSFFYKNKMKFIDFLNNNLETISTLNLRYLIRYTFNYSQLLKSVYSPINQSDILERHITFEYLWRGYDKSLLNEKIIQEEINQIKQGDIPYFTTRANSRDLFNYNGEVVVKNYFQYDGITAIKKKLNEFSIETLHWQENILNRALYIHGFSQKSDVLLQESIKISSKCDSPNLISQIAEILYSLNDPKEKKYFTYVDYVISKEDVWDQGLQRMDLFQGTCGIGLFFMAYYKLSKDNIALNVVHRLLNQALEYIRNNQALFLDSYFIKLGVMNFPISLLVFYVYGKKILGKELPTISDEILNIVLDYIENKYKYDKYFDYFSGSAGLILVLIEIFKIHPYNRIKKIIFSIGDFLVKSSINIKDSAITWKKEFFDMWGGFAHGNSGISYALFKLSDFTKSEYFFKAALGALKYDQSLFDPSEKTWKKTLYEKGEIHHSWGSGCAGIALSRQLISPMYHNGIMRQEIRTALDIIKKDISCGYYTDHSVGSGLLGLIEIVGFLDKKTCPEKCLIDFFLNKISLDKIICGGWEQNPIVTGLYYGYAGIGYNLIKLLHIKELPSLLWI